MATIIIISLLVLTLAGAMIVEEARANPWFGEPVPSSLQVPNRDSPSLEIQSPQNGTNYNNEVLLNFTVTKPESWVTTNVSCYISKVSYQINGQSFTLYQIDSGFMPLNYYSDSSNSTELTTTINVPLSLLSKDPFPLSKHFSVLINDTVKGQNSLEIDVTAFSIYSATQSFSLFYKVHTLDVAETVSFVKADGAMPTIPILTIISLILIIVLAVVVVVTGALGYLRRTKKQK
jgi:hypothetical protein